MITTKFLITITHKTPIADLADKIAARVYVLDGVENAEAVIDDVDHDQVIELAQALEQLRARAICDAVAALPLAGQEELKPSEFQAGFQLACEEIAYRLRTEEWENCHKPIGHNSDCAVHNEPAYPNGPCDCSPVLTEATS